MLTLTIPLTPIQFAQTAAYLKSQGATIPDPLTKSGRVTYSNVVFDYTYVPEVSAVTLSLVSKPSLLPESYIESRLKSWFAQPQK